MLSERSEHVACGGFSAKDLAHAKEKPWRYTAVACEVGLPLYGILQPFSKRVNLSEKEALSIQSVQKA